MHPATRTLIRRRLAAIFVIASTLVLAVCTDATAPGRATSGRLAFNPVFSRASQLALQSSAVDIDNVHLIIRNGDGTIVLDTVVVFPPGADALQIFADVPVHGNSEPFTVNFQLRSGDQVLFEGTQEFVAHPGGNSGTTSDLPVAYVGPGANATQITVTPALTTLTVPATVQLAANVLDGDGHPITGVPLAWVSSDETLATVSSSGLVTALKRGTATITASTLGGVTGDARVGVVLPPSQIRVVSGGTQTGNAGATLPQPLVVELLASDGVPVPGVTVTFSGATGGVTFVPPTAITDAVGRASTVVTLGTAAGPATFAAATGPLTAPATATVTPGPAFRIVVSSGDAQAAVTGTTLPQPLAALVTDQFNNPVAGTAVGWTRLSGAGNFGGATSTTTQSDATGIARATYTLGTQPGSEVIRAVHAIAGFTTFTLTALERPPSAIATASPATQTGVVGTPTQSLSVLVTDALGRGVPGIVTTWVATGGTTLGTPTSTTDANGRASVSGTFSTQTGTSTVTVSIAGVATPAQFTLTATAGAPAQMTISAGQGQVAPASTAVAVAPSVRVADAFGNPVAGVTVTFAVTAGGGAVTASAQTTSALGIATVGSWTLGTGGPQALNATAGALFVTFNATTTAGLGPLSLVIISGDAQTAFAGTPLAAPMVVEVRDTANTPVPGINVQFTVTGGGATPASLLVASNGLGRASFTPTLGPPGPQTVDACIVGCGAPTGFTATSVAATNVRTWTGVTSTDWSVASNWNPAIVPTAVSDILIPNDLGNNPILVAPVTVNHLTVQGTLSLSGFQITVGGDLDATSGSVAGGTIRMTGLGNNIGGSLPAVVIDASANITALSSTTINGSLTIQNNARYNAGTSFTNISGALSVLTGGRLLMTDGDANVTVQGDATFTARDMGNADLTAGTLVLFGNFTASGFLQAFRATGTHATRFFGSGAQSIFFSFPSSTQSQFQQFEVLNSSGAGVSLTSGAYTAGNAYQDGRMTINNTFTWTIAGALSLGSASTTTANGPVNFGSCTFAPGAVFTGFACPGGGPTATWLGTTSTDWNAPTNWSTGSVPLSTTNVSIPAGTPFGVALAGAVVMNNLTVASGAIVSSGFQMQVAGNISTVGATFIGGGTIVSNTTGATITGTVPALTVNGPLTLAGTTTVNGNLSIASLGVLDLAAFAMTVNGGFDMTSANAHIRMNNVAATLTITGNASFNGANMGNTDLTAGLIDFKSNFIANGTFGFEAFRATSGHTTRFSGTGAQAITFAIAGVTESTFGSLDITNTSGSGVTLSASNAFVAGTMSQTGRFTVITPRALTIAGALTLGSGSNTIVTGSGTLTSGSCTPIGGAFFSGFTCGAALTTWLGATTTDWNTPGNWSPAAVPGPLTNVSIPAGTPNQVVLTGGVSMNNLTVASGATFNTGGFQLQVGGNISTTGATFAGGGSILSTAISSTLAGNVPAMFMNGTLTLAGLTTVSGNVQIVSGGVLDIGSSVMTINGNLDLSPVANLKMNNASATLIVTGNATFNGNDMGDTDLTDGSLEIRGNFVSGGGFTQSFRATGNHVTVFSGTGAQTISFVSPSLANSRFQNVHIANTSGAGVSVSTNAFANGSVNQFGRLTVDISRTFAITGAISLSATSNTAANGTLNFGSCSFSAGAIFTGFSCTPNLTWNGSVSSNWNTPANWTPAGSPASANVSIGSGAPNNPQLQANSSVGDIVLSNSALIDLNGFTLTVDGNLTGASVLTITGVGNLTMDGSGKTVSGVLPSLIVSGSVTASAPVTIIGALSLFGGTLNVGTTTVGVGGTFQNIGTLRMNSPSATMTITGDATFIGNAMGDVDLTDGLLDLKGNFSQGVSTQGFRGTGAHTTKFSGTALQTITFSNAGAALSRFQHVHITNSSGAGVSFSSDAYVAGDLLQGGTMFVPGGTSVTIAGTLTLGSGSNTTVNGTFGFAGCNDLGATTASGFFCGGFLRGSGKGDALSVRGLDRNFVPGLRVPNNADPRVVR